MANRDSTPLATARHLLIRCEAMLAGRDLRDLDATLQRDVWTFLGWAKPCCGCQKPIQHGDVASYVSNDKTGCTGTSDGASKLLYADDDGAFKAFDIRGKMGVIWHSKCWTVAGYPSYTESLAFRVIHSKLYDAALLPTPRKCTCSTAAGDFACSCFTS